MLERMGSISMCVAVWVAFGGGEGRGSEAPRTWFDRCVRRARKVCEFGIGKSTIRLFRHRRRQPRYHRTLVEEERGRGEAWGVWGG